jgi:hypothetical protein
MLFFVSTFILFRISHLTEKLKRDVSKNMVTPAAGSIATVLTYQP